MSRVQPPAPTPPICAPVAGSIPGSRRPFVNVNACSGGGHVFAVGGMYLSIVNGALPKALAKLCVVSEHVAGSGVVDVRLASFWRRHVYGFPAWSTCFVCAPSAFVRPLTFSQPP